MMMTAKAIVPNEGSFTLSKGDSDFAWKISLCTHFNPKFASAYCEWLFAIY